MDPPNGKIKWIYLLEKAKLGLVSLPPSYREVDPSIFLPSNLPQTPTQSHDESTPLLGSGPIRRNSNPIPTLPPPSKEHMERFFTEALDDQLEKIVNFYGRKEKEFVTEALMFSGEVSQYEGFDDIRSHPLGNGNGGGEGYQRRLPIPSFDPVDESEGESSSSSYPVAPRTPVDPKGKGGIRRSNTTPDHIGVVTSPGSLSSSSAYLLGGSGSRNETFWSRPSHKVQRLKFKKQATGIYVSLHDLNEYRELNHTGFSKILKKYEKVTGYRLKQAYMARVDACYPFTAPAADRLRMEVERVIGLYARIVTDDQVGAAGQELRSHLREHIVWERNTIWRDMVQMERRTASVGVRRKRSVGEGLGGPEKSSVWETFVETFFGRKALYFYAITLGFVGLLEWKLFEKIEQQNCFAILMYASALWAFEVLPLFVTSLIVPLLVVLLRVMRLAVPNPAGSIDYIRLPAKDAAKKVFSEMFSPVIMLLLGGFSLAAALSKHHIAKGLASIVLDRAGKEPKNVVLANIFVSTFASMWISNVAAPVLCFSLIAPILRTLPSRSPYAKCLIMGIALAANVGGMASPISSPQNIIAIGVMKPAISWSEWFLITLPVCVVIDLAIWAILLIMYRPTALYDEEGGDVDVPGKASYFEDNPITGTQWYILAVTAVTIALWCVEGSIEGLVGDMGIIAIFPIVAFYGTGILSKDDWNSQLWTVVILAMGGTSLGKAVDSSGLLAEITSYITPHLTDLSPFMCILLFSGVVLVVASFISHTVAALILLPVVAQIGAGLGDDPSPRMFVMAITLICSGAMGLPVSSFPNMNAISLEDPTGEPWLAVADFIQVGLLASVVAWGAILGVGYPIMQAMGFK
ncbi:low-affinity phosphate transporter [Phlyctochytrium planicorne]|nr:low-affinity phosphate transporter [Phlyctochytrium planicorne]